MLFVVIEIILPADFFVFFVAYSLKVACHNKVVLVLLVNPIARICSLDNVSADLQSMHA